MAFYNDSPNVLTNVDWYFAEEDSGEIPYEHPFGSRIYDRKEFVQDVLGERYSPVPYRKGQKPYPLGKGGLCGTEEQWTHGASAMDPLPLRWPGSNWPRCCSSPEQDLIGTVLGYPASGTQIPSVCTELGFGVNLPAFFTGVISVSMCEYTTTFSVPYINVTPLWFHGQVGVSVDRALQCNITCGFGQIICVLNLTSVWGIVTPVDYRPPDFVDPVARLIRWDFDASSPNMNCNYAAGSFTLTWVPPP